MIANKKNEPIKVESSPEQSTPSQTATTILAEGVLFKGDFQAEEPMLIHGEIQGNIKSTSDVTLSATSQLTGNLEAKNTVVAGITKGDIRCKNTTTMEEKGEIKGDVSASRFIMSEDAVFNGNLKINKEKAPAASPLKEETLTQPKDNKTEM